MIFWVLSVMTWLVVAAGCSGWFVWCHGRGVVCVGAVA